MDADTSYVDAQDYASAVSRGGSQRRRDDGWLQMVTDDAENGPDATALASGGQYDNDGGADETNAAGSVAASTSTAYYQCGNHKVRLAGCSSSKGVSLEHKNNDGEQDDSENENEIESRPCPTVSFLTN